MNEELIKEKFRNIDKELEVHDKRIMALEKTYSIMEKMDYRVGNIEDAIKKIDNKLEEATDSKVNKWNKLLDYLFYFLIALVLSYAVSKLGLK